MKAPVFPQGSFPAFPVAFCGNSCIFQNPSLGGMGPVCFQCCSYFFSLTMIKRCFPGLLCDFQHSGKVMEIMSVWDTENLQAWLSRLCKIWLVCCLGCWRMGAGEGRLSWRVCLPAFGDVVSTHLLLAPVVGWKPTVTALTQMECTWDSRTAVTGFIDWWCFRCLGSSPGLATSSTSYQLDPVVGK